MIKEIKDQLLLVWKDPVSRQRFVVGKLWYEQDTYHFRYVQSREELADYIGNYGIEKAEGLGFLRLIPFQNIEETYSSEVLFYVFARRLPDRRRNDFAELAAELGLEQNCTPMGLLRATGGRLATDTMEFIHPLVFKNDGEFNLEFYVAGWRHYDGEKVVEQLSVGTPVDLYLEPENKYDPFAVCVVGPENTKLGYVPVYYSRYLDEVVKSRNYEAWVTKIGPEENPQLRLQVKVVGHAPVLAAIVSQLEKKKQRRTNRITSNINVNSTDIYL